MGGKVYYVNLFSSASAAEDRRLIVGDRRTAMDIVTKWCGPLSDTDRESARSFIEGRSVSFFSEYAWRTSRFAFVCEAEDAR